MFLKIIFLFKEVFADINLYIQDVICLPEACRRFWEGASGGAVADMFNMSPTSGFRTEACRVLLGSGFYNLMF